MSRHLAGFHRAPRSRLGTLFVCSLAASGFCAATLIAGSGTSTGPGIANAAEPPVAPRVDPLAGPTPRYQTRVSIKLQTQPDPIPARTIHEAPVWTPWWPGTEETKLDEAIGQLAALQASVGTPPAPADAGDPTSSAPDATPQSQPTQQPTTTPSSMPPPPTPTPTDPGFTPEATHPKPDPSTTSPAMEPTPTSTATPTPTTTPSPTPTASEPDAGEDADPNPPPTCHHRRRCP